MPRPLLIALGVAGLAALPPASPAVAADGGAAAASSFTVVTSGASISRIGAFRVGRNPTIGAAVRVFGRPSSRRRVGNTACHVEWRRLRLRITFANFGLPPEGQTVCGASASSAQRFTARSSRFRTSRFLRVGARSSTILDRHPAAEFRQGTWWLTTAVSPYGEEGEEFPVLQAIVSGGRVRALAGWIGAAGE